jgi:hypothetical protein
MKPYLQKEREENMGSKRRQAQNGRKASFERNLKNRLALLLSKGMEAREIGKDTLVKKMRANIEAINNRLKAIDANEKKTAELAKMKAEKAATPSKEPEAVKEEKKVKEAPVSGKEKAAAPKKDQEDGKVKKSKEAPAEGKGKKKKKEDTNPEKPE